MATVLLSRSTNFRGSDERDSGTLTRRSVHPASPVLLQKWPTGAPAFVARLRSSKRTSTHLKFENRLGRFDPKTSNHSLYLIKLRNGLSYPEETSEGTSYWVRLVFRPCPSLTIDLHVRTAAGYQSFLWLRPTGRSSPSFGSQQQRSHSNPAGGSGSVDDAPR